MSFRNNPVYTTMFVALALVAVGEGAGIFFQQRATRRAEAALQRKRADLRAVAAVKPTPSAEMAGRIEADLERTDRALATMRASLKGHGPEVKALEQAPAPKGPADAFFDIATFVERMRDRARAAGVGVKPDERFGFAEYANAGPQAEMIGAVFHERQIAEHLLEALFEAHPRQLLAVARERPEIKTAAGPAGHAAPRAGGPASPDFFEIDPRISARVPGYVDATAFRLTFIGQTAALRALLNKVAGFQLPLVVRAVEVSPAGAGFDEKPSPADEKAVAPLVARALSRFTVTIELVELEPLPES